MAKITYVSELIIPSEKDTTLPSQCLAGVLWIRILAGNILTFASNVLEILKNIHMFVKCVPFNIRQKESIGRLNI